MVWDITKPAGGRALNLGDDDIREFKSDVEDSFQAEGSFPGADTSNPAYIHTPSYGNTASRPATNLVTGRLYYNTQTKAIERYNSVGPSWDVLDVSGNVVTPLAGAGLVVNGTALDVNVDGSTLEISADVVRVKDLGISSAKIAAAAVTSSKIDTSVAGDGLSGGGGSALSVNVDGSTIETSSDTLRVKDGGITAAKLASASVNGSKFIVTTITYSSATIPGAIANCIPVGLELDLSGGAATFDMLVLAGLTFRQSTATASTKRQSGALFQSAAIGGLSVANAATDWNGIGVDSATFSYIAIPSI